MENFDEINIENESHWLKKTLLNFKKKKRKLFANFWVDLVLNVLVIAILVLIIRGYIFSPFQVSGPSMCNTLNYFQNECNKHSPGEQIIVNKFIYQNFFGWQVGLPKRGDIIVFHVPARKENLIKRVIGLPGETVKILNGEVYIINEMKPKGKKLEENYLNSQNRGKTLASFMARDAEFTVPEGYYFVMGDNRSDSTDSRTCFTSSSENCGKNHFVAIKDIEGKAAIVFWPLEKIKFFEDLQYSI